MAEPRTVTAYIDYKSPYAYLAKDLAYDLERDFPVRVDWLPYVLDIPSFLGSAPVDYTGRGQAKNPGLVIRGPQKIWASTLAACGMLYAKRQGDAVLRRYHDMIFERFWKRELDIEHPDVIGAVLAEAGARTARFWVY